MVQESGTNGIPFSMKGVVIGVNTATIDVVWDTPFLGGNNMSGRCVSLLRLLTCARATRLTPIPWSSHPTSQMLRVPRRDVRLLGLPQPHDAAVQRRRQAQASPDAARRRASGAGAAGSSRPAEPELLPGARRPLRAAERLHRRPEPQPRAGGPQRRRLQQRRPGRPAGAGARGRLPPSVSPPQRKLRSQDDCPDPRCFSAARPCFQEPPKRPPRWPPGRCGPPPSAVPPAAAAGPRADRAARPGREPWCARPAARTRRPVSAGIAAPERPERSWWRPRSARQGQGRRRRCCLVDDDCACCLSDASTLKIAHETSSRPVAHKLPSRYRQARSESDRRRVQPRSATTRCVCKAQI